MYNLYTDYNEFSEQSSTTTKVGVDDVLEIFSKTEVQATDTEYGYSEQKAIGQKATILATGEALKRYSLPIKLHHFFCDPAQIINDLKEKASNSEVINYFQADSFIGKYVISKISENMIERYQDKILCAEITVELLESPSSKDKEFKSQTKTSKQPSGNIKKVETKPQAAVRKVTEQTKSTFDLLTDEALNIALRQGDSYLNSVSNGISTDIKNGVINVI